MSEKNLLKRFDDIRKAATSRAINGLENIRLNKAGTIGTEKIRSSTGGGGWEDKVEVKLGKLGKIGIPTGKFGYNAPSTGGKMTKRILKAVPKVAPKKWKSTLGPGPYGKGYHN